MYLVLSATYLSPRWGLRARGFGVFYTPSAPLGLLEAGGQCPPYNVLFKQVLTYRGVLPTICIRFNLCRLSIPFCVVL